LILFLFVKLSLLQEDYPKTIIRDESFCFKSEYLRFFKIRKDLIYFCLKRTEETSREMNIAGASSINGKKRKILITTLWIYNGSYVYFLSGKV